MSTPAVKLTRPMVHDEALWFAAYEFGWGYKAFKLPADIALRELGALDASPRQLTLAFELGRQRIAGAIAPMCAAYAGQRISLKTGDLSA
jgi:hypothetical protein